MSSDNELVPGDWIIHVGDATYGDLVDRSYNEKAVYLQELTKDHMAIYDPEFGSSVVLERSSCPGFILATELMVEAAWDEARHGGLRGGINPVDDKELAAYPYRRTNDRQD